MVLRDRDSDSNGTLDERLWPTEDANWDVMALVNPSGVVVERYTYDPYGVQTVDDGSYVDRAAGSSYAWLMQFQGMRHDPLSGLDAADERWYSASIDSWTKIDPIRYRGGDLNLNRFSSANPISVVDPVGTDDWKPTAAIESKYKEHQIEWYGDLYWHPSTLLMYKPQWLVMTYFGADITIKGGSPILSETPHGGFAMSDFARKLQTPTVTSQFMVWSDRDPATNNPTGVLHLLYKAEISRSAISIVDSIGIGAAGGGAIGLLIGGAGGAGVGGAIGGVVTPITTYGSEMRLLC